MFAIHTKEEVSTLRVYLDGDSYEKKSTAIFSCTVHYISDDEAYISNARGDVPTGCFDAILKTLFEEGATTLRYERKGRLKKIDLVKKFT